MVCLHFNVILAFKAILKYYLEEGLVVGVGDVQVRPIPGNHAWYERTCTLSINSLQIFSSGKFSFKSSYLEGWLVMD